MAYGDERVIVDLKEVENGQILYTDKEGKQTTYYPCFSIWLEVQTLEVLTVLGEPNDGAQPPLVTRVCGTAALEARSISVVGDPKSKVRRLSITFDAADWTPKPVEPKEGEFSLGSDLGGAVLGFNRADWEFGNDDDWWISCYLPRPFIDALVADVRSAQLDGVKLNLWLQRLYSDTSAPVYSRDDLFIRPDRKDNSLENPDMAQGYVRAIHFTSSPRDLRKPEPVEPIEPGDEDAPPAPTQDPVAAAIVALGVRVDQMRSTLKWVGGFMVVALLFVAGR